MKYGEIEGILFQQLTNSTRIEHPDRDFLGYNTEEERIEFYIKRIDRWFWIYHGELGEENPILPSLFYEDFEEGWLINNIFSKIFEEVFENNWYIDNIFNNLFTDDLEINWFFNNIFNQLFVESFESGW